MCIIVSNIVLSRPVVFSPGPWDLLQLYTADFALHTINYVINKKKKSEVINFKENRTGVAWGANLPVTTASIGSDPTVVSKCCVQ